MNTTQKTLAVAVAPVAAKLAADLMFSYMKKQPGSKSPVSTVSAKSNKQRPKERPGFRDAPVSESYRGYQTYFRSEKPTPGASARFVGRDYIGVYGSATSGTDFVFPVWLQNATLFPRLQSLGEVFELYRFKKVKLSAVGVAASTSPGAYTLLSDFYPDGAAFTAAEARNEEGAVSKKFWEDGCMEMDCRRATRPWYVTAEVAGPIATDAKLGDLHCFTDGSTAAINAVVELYVEYDIEFAQGQISAGVDLTNKVRRLLRKKVPSAAIAAALDNLERTEEPRRSIPYDVSFVRSDQLIPAAATGAHSAQMRSGY